MTNGVVNCCGCLRAGSQQGDGTSALAPECLVPSLSVNLAMGPPPPNHSAWSILEGYDLDCLSPFELGARTSTYPPDICKPKLLLSFLLPHLDLLFLFDKNVHSTPYSCYLSSHATTFGIYPRSLIWTFITSHLYFYWSGATSFSIWLTLSLIFPASPRLSMYLFTFTVHKLNIIANTYITIIPVN